MTHGIVRSSHGDGGTPPEYDAEIHNFQGLEVFTHNTPESMAAALGNEQPDGRVMTFTAPSLFMMSQSIGFIDRQRRIHHFSAQVSTDEQATAVEDVVWGAIESHGHTEADGVIKVDDQNGHVYQVYATEEPDEEDRLKAQVDAWAEDVRAASMVDPVDSLLQYVSEDGVTIADYTQGRHHRVTVLREAAGFTLTTVMEGMPYIPLQDNAPVVRWAKVVTS